MRAPLCRYCGGTGHVWLDRSWFTADGTYAVKCWLCKGVGRTHDNDAADKAFARIQKRKRDGQLHPPQV
jgi:hypothetical protein